jgi:hypothetical protein
MLFKELSSVRAQVPSMGVMGNTSAGAITSKNSLYLFYSGNGGDGIYYTSTEDGKKWNSLVKLLGKDIGLAILKGTSPDLVEFSGSVYLFFTGGGEDGIWQTTTNDLRTGTWQRVLRVVGVRDCTTSPSAVVFKDTLYVFYVGAGFSIYYASLTLGKTWSSAQVVPSTSVEGTTNPSAVVYKGRIYLFYRSGKRYTYVTFDGKSWAGGKILEIPDGSVPYSSPSALVLKDLDILHLAWTGAASDKGSGTNLFLARSFDGKDWTPPIKQFDTARSEAPIVEYTSPLLIEYRKAPYVFFTFMQPRQSAGIGWSAGLPPASIRAITRPEELGPIVDNVIAGNDRPIMIDNSSGESWLDWIGSRLGPVNSFFGFSGPPQGTGAPTLPPAAAGGSPARREDDKPKNYWVEGAFVLLGILATLGIVTGLRLARSSARAADPYLYLIDMGGRGLLRDLELSSTAHSSTSD